MRKLYQSVAIVSSLLLFFSCSRNYKSTSPVTAESETLTSGIYSSERKSQSEQIFIRDPAYKRFLVPPDIAYMQAIVYARGSSFAEVAKTVNSSNQKILAAVSQVSGCSASIIDYNHPRKTTTKKIVTEDSIYSSNAVLQITISFADTNNIQGRIERVNQCIQAIPQIQLDNPQKKNSIINVNLSRAIPTVKDVTIYRQQLLDSKFSRLQSIAKMSNLPTQFQFDATKCTSNGLIKIGDRSLSNIELEIDFKCKQFDKLKNNNE